MISWIVLSCTESNPRNHTKQHENIQMKLLNTERACTIALIASVILILGCRNKESAPVASPTPNQSEEQTLNAVREIAARILEVDPQSIDVDTPLSKQKVPADEVDAVDIIIAIEDAFKIEIKEEETGGTEHLADRLTVRKLAELVARKKQGS